MGPSPIAGEKKKDVNAFILHQQVHMHLCMYSCRGGEIGTRKDLQWNLDGLGEFQETHDDEHEFGGLLRTMHKLK